MKKNIVLIIIVIILAAVSVWLLSSKSSSTISKELRDFAVTDTASVIKIFMANKQGDQVTLVRQQSGHWLLNNEKLARPDGIRLLLQTMHDIEVRSPVAKAAYNNTITRIATSGIKVEIYTNEGLFKTYYVGGPTMDQMGTYMYLESSTVPFVIHIPGFDGYLTPRYICKEQDWIVKNVFKLNDGELKRLDVVDNENSELTFSIIRKSNNDYSVLDASGMELPAISQDKVISYLQYYSLLNYESTEKSLSPEQHDSLISTVPFKSISLSDIHNQTNRIDLWRRPITDQTVNKSMEDGTPFRFDVDRMTASINGDTALKVVQYFSFGKLFRKPADFSAINSTN